MGTYIAMEERMEIDLWLVMQVSLPWRCLTTAKWSLLGVNQENLHVYMEDPADV
jgi:glycine cleavage system regulatory protein